MSYILITCFFGKDHLTWEYICKHIHTYMNWHAFIFGREQLACIFVLSGGGGILGRDLYILPFDVYNFYPNAVFVSILIFILHDELLFFSSFSDGFPFLQVMYDATGVRLHAGRQAEVIFLSQPSLSCFYPVTVGWFMQLEKTLRLNLYSPFYT